MAHDHALAVMEGTAHAMQTITLRLPAPLLEQITAEADLLHAHRSQFCRYLLSKGLKELQLSRTTERP